jgi:hypothetical protein
MIVLMVALDALAMCFNYVVNPYGAWRIALINPIFRKLTGDRAQMPYQLRTAAPETILIGSSRVQVAMRIEQGYRDGVLNASVGAATMADLARIIEVSLRNPQLKRIVWGVDFYAFNARIRRVNLTFEARIAFSPRSLIEDSLLSLDALGDSFDMLKRAARGRRRLPLTMASNIPWPTELICDQIAATHAHGLAAVPQTNIETGLAQVQSWFYSNYVFAPELAVRFREIVERARAHHVEVILFVPPMSEYELELIRQGGHWTDFERFKRAVAAVATVWDFAAYNPISHTDDLFLDVLHLKPAAGNEILRMMLGLEASSACGDHLKIITDSAVRLDPSSMDALLRLEERRRDEAASDSSQYSDIASAALRDPAGRQSANASSPRDLRSLFKIK